MIRHIVFFTVRDDGNRDRVHEGLKLLAEIPHAQVLEIGVNQKSDTLSREIDFVVYGEFADEAELAAYKAHPLYQASIDIVRPLRETRIAADFVAERAGEKRSDASEAA